MDAKRLLELGGLGVLAGAGAVAAFLHGNVFFAVFFGAATGYVWSDLLRNLLERE